MLAHGVAGGGMSVLRGGKFKDGFESAGFSQVMEVTAGYRRLGVSSAPRGAAGFAKNAAISAVVGGTASKLVGGKFANGAITGAFSRMFNDLHETKSYPNCSRYDKGPCGGSGYTGRTGSVTGFDEAGLQSISVNFSVGISVETTILIPGLGGGTLGLNAQFGGGVTGLYLYYPDFDSDPTGFSLGIGGEGNIAKGNGGWTGLFDNTSASVGPYSVSEFSSPDGSWIGYSAGGTVGAPVGVSQTRTNYVELF